MQVNIHFAAELISLILLSGIFIATKIGYLQSLPCISFTGRLRSREVKCSVINEQWQGDPSVLEHVQKRISSRSLDISGKASEHMSNWEPFSCDSWWARSPSSVARRLANYRVTVGSSLLWWNEWYAVDTVATFLHWSTEKIFF